MKISEDEVIHVANLARLNMDKASIERFAGQIGTILEYVDKLNRLDTKGVTPTAQAIYLTNAFREDVEREIPQQSFGKSSNSFCCSFTSQEQ